jgi:hypothetical protein
MPNKALVDGVGRVCTPPWNKKRLPPGSPNEVRHAAAVNAAAADTIFEMSWRTAGRCGLRKAGVGYCETANRTTENRGRRPVWCLRWFPCLMRAVCLAGAFLAGPSTALGPATSVARAAADDRPPCGGIHRALIARGRVMLATLPVLAGTLRVRGGADHVVLAGRADELRAGGGNDPYEMGGVCEEYGAEFGEGQFPVEDDETLAGLRAELEEVERELEDAQDARAVAEQVMETTYICIYIHFSIDLYMYVNTHTHTHTRIHVLYCRSTCGSKEQWRSNPSK